jgi:transposase
MKDIGRRIRNRISKRAKVHFDLFHLVYNASKLACDRLSEQAHSTVQAE